MKAEELVNKISGIDKDSFSTDDLRQLFPADLNLKTAINRLVNRGVLVVIVRGRYRLKNTTINHEKIATQIYSPSYVSFESALSKYGVINQGFNKITLATTRHSKKVELSGLGCEFIHLKSNLFFGFNLINGVYIAEVEKALLDEMYLISLGKRKVNTSEWNIVGLDEDKIRGYLKFFPQTVSKNMEEML